MKLTTFFLMSVLAALSACSTERAEPSVHTTTTATEETVIHRPVTGVSRTETHTVIAPAQ